MSLFTRRQVRAAQDLISSRPSWGATGSVVVTADSALQHSAVWACLRLRADLISTLPIDVFRKMGASVVGLPTPPVLSTPDGVADVTEWLYSSQVDLDRCGNTFGLITEQNAAGFPARIELQPIADCSVIVKDGVLTSYRIGGKVYGPEQVWHERQYTLAGLPVGLSPVAYAAMSIGQYQSAQKFATDWYANGGVPKAGLRNTAKPTVEPEDAAIVKSRFRAAIDGRDVFVSGSDWEYKPFSSEAVGMEWLEAQKFGITEVARFFNVPADLVDAAVQGSSITYANVVQRNLQFLVTSLQPAVTRRERALSRLLPQPRYVKLNTNALLRMDPLTQAQVLAIQIDKRLVTNTEARDKLDRQPLTPDEIAEFTAVYGPSKPAPVPVKNGAPE